MIIKHPLQIQSVLDWIELQDKIAYDIESTGLNVRHDKIIGFGISNATEGFYIVCKHYNAKLDMFQQYLFKEEIQVILNALKPKKLITFNGSFDMRMALHDLEVNLIDSIYSDALLAKHTCDEDFPFKLKEIAKKVYGEDATEEQKEMKASIKANGGTASQFYKADLEIIARYCIKDCTLTYSLNEKYEAQMVEENLTRFYFVDEVMPLYREVTIPMELNGVPVDLDLLEKTQQEISVEIELLKSSILVEIEPMLTEFRRWFLWKDYPPKRSGNFAQQIAQHCKWDLPKTDSGKLSITKKTLETVPESVYKTFLQDGAYLSEEQVEEIQMQMHGDEELFNLNSTIHLKKIFFEKLGETPLSRTPKGAPQVNDEFLENMAKKYTWAAMLQDYNKLTKLKGSYIDRIIEKQENGIFYPSFFQHRTISGRYGSDLQQLPRPKEDEEVSPVVLKFNNIIRQCFIAGEGYKFIDSDYESLEPHVFSHVSGDQGLKNIYIKGHDFYSTVAIKAEDIMNVSPDKIASNYLGKVNKVRRQSAKAYALGIPYGMEDFALSKTLNISQREARKRIANYLNGFPDLKAWMESSNLKVVTDGYIVTEAGRRRRFPRAPKLWTSYGPKLLDSLWLWKEYNERPKKYKEMKYLRKVLKNCLDNGKNVQIQGLSASIVNRSSIAIARELKRTGIKGYICANVHDQIITRVPIKDAERAKKIQQYLMENTYKISVPLKAPAEISDNFYDGH